MSNKIQSCLSAQMLEQIGKNDVSPDELLAIEEHISECPRCREMFDSQYTSSQWSELIQPALSETQMALSSVAEEGADHSSAILKLLGPTDDPNMLGRIGNYEIVGIIGQGGMGAVFKGFDRSLNRFVAIKMLLPHLAASGAARKRFAREGQAVAAVVDDHVMAIHCVDQWQGIPYLVMTYSRGVSLQKRLNDHGPLEVREILRIGMQAAKGLAAAHAQGIVHRDIKPSNILLDQNVERVQLVDFGLARAVDDASLTCSGTLAGTPQYMSPEQARAEAVDHRSDLFSLGSVLYAMCAGYAPFRADSSYSVLRLIIEKEPRPIREINSDIPDWLCAIIEKLMSKSPDDRYASADEVATIFKQCLAHVQDPVQHALPPGTQAFKDRHQTPRKILSQLQRWFPIMNDKRIVSLIALILLLIAMLVPWPIATMASLETSVAFFVPAALLSLGLALLSRSEYFSRIVLWCFGLTIGLAVLGLGISVPIWMARESKALVIASEAARAAEMRAVVELKMQQLRAESEAMDARTEVDQMTQKRSAFHSQTWQEYVPTKLEAARKAGKVVVIDFTADWCLFGKTLKASAFNSDDVMQAIDSKDTVLIEVDLTKDGIAGWGLLQEYGQRSIPLLVIEGPGTLVPWKSNAYTASSVVEAVKAARKGNPKDSAGREIPDKSPQSEVIGQRQGSKSIHGTAIDVMGTATTADAPLMIAIDRFNEQMHAIHLSHDQPPLTKDELVACASWKLEYNGELSESLKAGITKIAKQYQLPDQWTIEGKYIDFKNDPTPVRAFEINLQTNHLNEHIAIRRRFLNPSNDYSTSPATHDQDIGDSLASAIKQFNASNTQAGGQDQPPLTEDEVVAAILHTQTIRDKYAAIGVTDWLFDRFQNIALTRQLPKGATIEVKSTLGGKGDSTYTMWAICITMVGGGPGREGLTCEFGIREQFVSVKHGDAGSVQWGKPAKNGLQAGGSKDQAERTATKGFEESMGTNSSQTNGKAERTINGWPVPKTIEETEAQEKSKSQEPS